VNYKAKESVWNNRLYVSRTLEISLNDINNFTIEQFTYMLKLSQNIQEDRNNKNKNDS
jgi:hypothetical protein